MREVVAVVMPERDARAPKVTEAVVVAEEAW